MIFRVIAYFFLIIMASCSKKSEGNRMINSTSSHDTLQRKHADRIDFHTKEKDSLMLEITHHKKNSLYKLKTIQMAWINKDSIPASNEFILFENGRLKYIIDNKVYIDRKYSLIKHSSYEAIGEYLLGINSEKYHSINFYKDSVIIFQNAEDENSFVFF